MAISDLQTAATAAETTATTTPSAANAAAWVAAEQALIAAINVGLTGAVPYAGDPGATAANLSAATASLSTALSALEDAQSATIAQTPATSSQVSTGGVKNYQITVPDFQEVTSPFPITTLSDGTTAVPTLTGATSFLRLGSAPAPADWSSATYANSANLARLVGDPNVISTVENIALSSSGMSLSTTSPVDDSNVSTLESGTGDSFSDGFLDGRGNTSVTTGADPSANNNLPSDLPAYGNAFGINQDASYLPGFADDTRMRGPAGTAASPGTCPPKTQISNGVVDNTNQNRQVETLKLLTKGGWWDHSDGNHISTTCGDKVDIVGGNYKLVVLGRQPVPSLSTNPTAAEVTAYRTSLTALSDNAFVTDVSGGHFQEQYPSPTPCIKTIEYVQDDAGMWTLYQDNGLGNLITKLKGRTVDLFQGSSRETYVGSESSTVLWANGGPGATPAAGTTATDLRLDPMVASYTWAQSVYSQTGSESKPIGTGVATPLSSNTPTTTSGPQPTSVSTNADVAIGSANGSVVSATWASRVASYVGSSGYEVATVYSETHAGSITSKTYSTGGITSLNSATSGTIAGTTTAGAITNVVTAKGAVANVTAAGGDVINVTAAPVALNLTAAGATTNLVAGFDLINVNAALNIVNLNIGLGLFNIDLTPISVHMGVASTELAATKNLNAALVYLGLSPSAAAAAATAADATSVGNAAAMGVYAVAIGGIGVGAGESAKPS